MKEITEIIEIVFEKVQLEKAVEFLTKLLLISTLKDFSISTDSSEINLQSKEELFKSIKYSSDGSFYFNFSNSILNNIRLSRLGFQILKYDNIYELNLAIDENEMRQKISISDLQKSAAYLARELKATNYYCGYEPAADEETRLFSGNTMGPLFILGNMNK